MSRPTIIELREFYATPRGRMAARALSRMLSAMRRDMQSTSPPPPNTVDIPLLAYGYAVPVLDGAPAGVKAATRHLMHPAQGCAAWPNDAQNRVTLAADDRWELPDNAAAAVLLMHAVEHSADPVALLQEAWRVLTPQGQLWLVLPNRRGLWAGGMLSAEGTLFGRGQPYTAMQARKLLHAAQFVPEGWRRALFTPPFKSALGLATAPVWEALGPWLASPHGGAIIFRAVKQLYAPVGMIDDPAQPQPQPRGFSMRVPDAAPV